MVTASTAGDAPAVFDAGRRVSWPVVTHAVVMVVAAVLAVGVVAAAARSWVPLVGPTVGWVAAAIGLGTVTVGLVGHRRRPGSSVGPLLAVAGLLFLVGRGWWSATPLVYTIGLVTWQFHRAVLGQAMLALPTGRLKHWFDRGVVAWIWLVTVAGSVRGMFPYCPADAQCPHNLLVISTDPAVREQVVTITNQSANVAGLLVLATLAWHFVAGHPAERRALGPGLLGLLAFLGLYFVPSNLGVVGFGLTDLDSWVLADTLAAGLVPTGVAIGLFRGRAGPGRVGRLAIEIHATDHPVDALRVGLVHTLGDPTLQITYASPEGWRDAMGRATTRPVAAPGRALTTVTGAEGMTLAVIDTTDHLLDEPSLVEGALAIARLVLDNRRLADEVEAQLGQVQVSRRRIVEARDLERRRIERNLHDGAQQHLLSVALNLRLAGKSGSEGALRDGVDTAATEITRAVRDLQDLGRGLHPTVLTDKGLTAAVEELAARASIPVTLDLAAVEPDDLAQPVATTAYYIVAEAMTNVVKHASASRAIVRITTTPTLLRLEVSDDGCGGADPDSGSGLAGLRDRVDAAGGTLAVSSTPGEGTRIVAVLNRSP